MDAAASDVQNFTELTIATALGRIGVSLYNLKAAKGMADAKWAGDFLIWAQPPSGPSCRVLP
jgi:hypothetical protein